LRNASPGILRPLSNRRRGSEPQFMAYGEVFCPLLAETLCLRLEIPRLALVGCLCLQLIENLSLSLTGQRASILCPSLVNVLTNALYVLSLLVA
jgi:hypothetical protein